MLAAEPSRHAHKISDRTRIFTISASMKMTG
jgi:hypothetical protein